MTVKRYDAHTNNNDFKSDWHEKKDGPMVRYDDYAALLKERDALAAENAYLLPKAASELSNAWMLHKYWVGIQVALMHMRVGRLTSAEEWLIGTVSGPGIEAPDLKLLPEIEAWATEQQKDSIGHVRALEIIKSETPATDAAIANIKARGVEMFADSLRAVGGHAHPYSVVAIEFANQMRKEAGNGQ
jgi:hypothetical protein